MDNKGILSKDRCVENTVPRIHKISVLNTGQRKDFR